MLEDTLLKLKFNSGDKDALRRIYEKYKDDLLRLAVGLLSDFNLAEDVVNDAFVSFVESVGTLRLTGNLKSFLTACVLNQARNVYRAGKRRKTASLNEAAGLRADGTSPQQVVIFGEDCKQLDAAMNQLPYEQRETVILHCCNGMRFNKIAALQNIPVNTAKSRYRYGLDKLRLILNRKLNHEGHEESEDRKTCRETAG